MTTVENPPMRELIKNIYRQCEAAFEKEGWKKCPNCGEEWSKLVECKYFDYGEKKGLVCIRCAEYPISLKKISEENPILGICVEIKKRPMFKNVQDEDLYKTQHYAIVSLGEWRFKVSASETWVLVEGEKSKSIDFFANNFQAWSFLRNKFAKGENSDIKPKEMASW